MLSGEIALKNNHYYYYYCIFFGTYPSQYTLKREIPLIGMFINNANVEFFLQYMNALLIYKNKIFQTFFSQD